MSGAVPIQVIGALVGDPFAVEVDLPLAYALDYNYLGDSQIALVAAAIPEPSTFVLTAFGLLGLVGLRRRRSRV